MKPDILIPPLIEKRWRERIRPAIEGLGIPPSTELSQILGNAEQAGTWALMARRPKPGSVVIPQKSGSNYRCGDATFRFEEREKGDSSEDPAIVKSCHGLSAIALAANPGSEQHIEWQDAPLLAVSSDLVTLLADLLPGKDAFVAVELWANAAMPVFALAQRPSGELARGSIQSFRGLGSGDVWLVRDCKKCDATGEVECKKCDGTGDYIGKFGDRMGDCNACEGTGDWDCNKCSGSGMVGVFHSSISGDYRCLGSEIQANKVHAWDAIHKQKYALNQGADSLLEKLWVRTKLASREAEAVVATQREIAVLNHCLDLAMQVQDTPADLFSSKSIRLSDFRSTSSRQKGRVILSFALPKPPAWARQEKLPFECGTPVRFSEDQHGREPVGLEAQGEIQRQKPIDPTLFGLESTEGRPRLLVSFPVDFETRCLPEECFIRPDVIPPSELAQQKELSRWCSPVKAPRQLSSLIPNQDSERRNPPPHVPTENSAILANPRQQEALNWIMSAEPLILVKGPPGTGKTTVITEAVLQCIVRGWKVLVCSETHQAVANVLERLHRNSRIRMIRHAREDNQKISELERQYLEGGSRQKFIRRVRSHTGSQVDYWKARMLKLEPLPNQIKNALDSAVIIAAENEATSHAIRNSDEELSMSLKAIESEEAEIKKNADSTLNARLKALANMKVKAEAIQHQLQKRERSLEGKKKALRCFVWKAAEHFALSSGRLRDRLPWGPLPPNPLCSGNRGFPALGAYRGEPHGKRCPRRPSGNADLRSFPHETAKSQKKFHRKCLSEKDRKRSRS